MKIQSRMGILSRLLWTAAGFIPLLSAFWLVSCEKHSNAERVESITVYSDAVSVEPLEYALVSVRGGNVKLYVDSNIDFTATWQDGESTPWVKVLDCSETDPQTGKRIVSLEVMGRNSGAGNTSVNPYRYTRRTGMLILSPTDPALNYNRILPVHQGVSSRTSSDFSFLKYGESDPRIEGGETSIDEWTAAQLNYGFSSTQRTDGIATCCFGKNGYIRLGDGEGHGADLLSPFTSSLRSDSLLMVAFKAVAYTDFYSRVKDNNKFTVEVLDGGVLSDFVNTSGNGEGTGEGETAPARTSIDLEAPYYDFDDEDFPSTMWDGSNFLIFIESTAANPLTANTRIRISCGSLDRQETVNSRIFIDDFYIYRLEKEEKDYYFSENGGSGKDMVLGAVSDEEGQQ